MQKYVREDGTLCEAIQFKGFTEESDHAFEVVELLNKAELGAFWVAEIVDETEYVEVEDDEGDMIFAPKVHPEHIWMEACKDAVWVDDYIIVRDGETYTMAGEIFEAIWSLSEVHN